MFNRAIIRTKQKKFLLSLLFLVMVCGVGVMTVNAAVNITPSTGQVILGLPQQFSVTGLNYSRTYDIEVDDSVEYDDLAPTSDGELIFSITIVSEGNHKVEVVDTEDTTVVATASIYGLDIIGYVVAIMSIIFVLVIVIRIFAKAEDLI